MKKILICALITFANNLIVASKPADVSLSDAKVLQERLEKTKHNKLPRRIIKLLSGQVLLCQAKCDYYSTLKESYIALIETPDDKGIKVRGKGYATRVFKQAIAQLHKEYPQSLITLDATPQSNNYSEERLVELYQYLGATIDSIQAEKHKKQKLFGTPMFYPFSRAAAMAALLPILEPEPIIQPNQKPNESPSIKVTPHDPLLVIMSYIDEEKPKEGQS